MAGFPTLKVLGTLTLDWIILHTLMHHLSTSTYMTNLDGRMYTRIFEIGFIRSNVEEST